MAALVSVAAAANCHMGTLLTVKCSLVPKQRSRAITRLPCPALPCNAFNPTIVHGLLVFRSTRPFSLRSVTLMQLSLTSLVTLNWRPEPAPAGVCPCGAAPIKKPRCCGALLSARRLMVDASSDYLRVPTTSISTRRFLARPSLVLLSATGCNSPLPSV